jgi:hypothetical protein
VVRDVSLDIAGPEAQTTAAEADGRELTGAGEAPHDVRVTTQDEPHVPVGEKRFEFGGFHEGAASFEATPPGVSLPAM